MPVDRRDFLKYSALAVAATSGMPGFLARAAAQAAAEPASNGRTLVVIQLTGGNDGLNTLVPYTNGAYYAARPNIAIPKKDVLTVTPDLGLHPGLKPLMPLWDSGHLAWMENVGYPNPNRSHFASMAIWHTADPTQAQAEGWIGRVAEKIGGSILRVEYRRHYPAGITGRRLQPPFHRHCRWLSSAAPGGTGRGI